ncbi:MAG: anti-sigma factor family protein [Armatimonadota bacterium]
MCEWERKVSAYWDNALTSEEAKKVAEHLTTCNDCQRAIKAMQKIRQLLLQESLPTDSKAVSLILERLNREGAFRTPKWRQKILQFDSWLMNPQRTFRVAMIMALISALFLANLSAPISQATERVQGSLQKAIQGISLQRVWQEILLLTRVSRSERR